MALIPAASSLPRPKRTTCSTRAIHGPRQCCMARVCRSILTCCWPIRSCSRWIGSRCCRRGSAADQQGGAEPFGHTTVDPGGKTTVVPAGGGGLLLLKLRHPASNNGRSNAIRRQHMAGFLATSRGFRTDALSGGRVFRKGHLLRKAAQGNRVNAQISSPAQPREAGRVAPGRLTRGSGDGAPPSAAPP